ncbi:transposase [Streptomyces sp. NPDC057705]|uniref:transposase n=1 Tax=Streptomyces sp. NPDC057705 TaxID=3346222 RepID=UPI0036ABA8FF
MDAIRHLVAGGISWRAMPARGLPRRARFYAFFRRRREHGLIAEFHDRVRGTVREREGREAEPTAGMIDAQSVGDGATVPAASRGYDGGKKVPGRKRHIVTDTLGLLLAVAVTAANIGDRDAAAGLLMRLRRLHRDSTLVWAEGGSTGSLVGWCRDQLQHAQNALIVRRQNRHLQPFPQGGTVDPGTARAAAPLSPRLRSGVVSTAEAARASSSSSGAITCRSSSISAASTASNTAANRATSTRTPSTRTRAAVSRSSGIPGTDSIAHPSLTERKQDAGCSLIPSYTMPDQQISTDHVRLGYGFSDMRHQASGTGRSRGA